MSDKYGWDETQMVESFDFISLPSLHSLNSIDIFAAKWESVLMTL